MRKAVLVFVICLGLILTIISGISTSADSTATITIKIHRIQKLDEIEESTSDEADWYYYIGISEDGGNSYDWTSPESIPMNENADDWKANTNHIFSGITGTSVDIAILLCEYDEGENSDDLADITSRGYGGSNYYWDDFESPITPNNLPPTLENRIFNYDIFKASYNLKTDELTGDKTTIEDGYYKTSGAFDTVSVDQNDAALYFDIWDNYNNPTCIMSISDTYVKAGEVITFDASLSTAATGFEIESYQWDFTDNGKWNANGKTVNYTFDEADTYKINLRITDSFGQKDEEFGYVVVYPNMEASFTYSPSSPTTLDTIEFTDTTEIIGADLVTWFWSFGDYSTSTMQNPTHTYSRGGTYSVKLKVTADDWQTTDYEIETIVVIEYASITGTVKDQNGNPINGATIKLYDGETVLKSVTTDENGEYQISEVETGFYDIEGMKSGYDNNKKTSENMVVGENTINFILPPENKVPNADFKYSPKDPTAGKKISFKDASIDTDGTIESFTWDFGDGKTSTKQNTSHTYISSGKYNVTLTVIDNGGKNNTYSVVINVGDASPGFEFIFVLLSIVIFTFIYSKKKYRKN
jgi:PKD repeat protein